MYIKIGDISLKDFNIEDFINDYNEAQMVVIGIGSQLTSDKYGEISAMNEIITFLIII